jgi:polyhydroxyalkanoate synthesis repressor PhaR
LSLHKQAKKFVLALPLRCVILRTSTFPKEWLSVIESTPENVFGFAFSTQARSSMSEPRVIKKYPNRRLYDTVESRYITLADVRRLVVERIDFVVMDKKNNGNITRSILLQVIAEQENMSEPILSQEFMVHVIRAYGTSSQAQVSPHLEASLKQLMGQQQTQPLLRERAKVIAGADAPAMAAPLRSHMQPH